MNLDPQWIWAIHLAATWTMVGIILFVQVVHYPLMRYAEAVQYVTFHESHMRRVTWVVLPTMLLELGSGLWLVFHDAQPMMVISMALLGAVWVMTFAIHVPQHAKLARGFDPATHRALVRTNALRTALWFARGILVIGVGL